MENTLSLMNNPTPATNIVHKSDTIDNMNAFQRGIKRFIDLFASILGLILLSPVFIIVIAVQLLSSEGSVFFKQERIGKNGKPFNIIKFRTMVKKAEQNGPELAHKNDKRLTRFGKFLREHHLDEMPQLWNVLVGDMSLVGYRPERKFYIDQIMKENPDYQLLYCSRPGITSYATIYNGYTDTMEKMLKRLEMDLDYLKKRTILLDFKILFQTIFHVGKGEKI